ncbi:NlpC/P60 family protein [Streptomyces sp. HD1123-B1]|uniref:C40 family peptidase n=1 Tax=Streptomyces huangiella TaxID=3228804 RepID=UPI003D7DD66A
MTSCRRVPKPGPSRVTVWTAATAAAAASAAALGAGTAGAEPSDRAEGHPTARRLSDRVERLYAEAERATERYNAAEARTDALRHQVDRIQDRVARGQERVNRMRVALGAFAGGQYRSGGIDPGLALILSEEPAAYLDKATTLERIGHRQNAQLRVFQGAQRTLRQQRAAAAGKLVRLEAGRKAVARHKREVRRKLAIARRLVDELPPDERSAYARASRGGRDPEPGALAGSLPASSSRAAAAFGAARAALGRPYAWGQAGPTAFDCSGLTQWAYARAGVAIPRTSQAQSGAGQRVPLSQARPGDLVVYRADGSHVAMYAGNGQVIHAPHPGAPVRYDPVGMMPISSVTRV